MTLIYLCGCYYHLVSTNYHIQSQKHYLPLVDSEVHSTILSTTSKTVLKQTFTNPSESDAISECIYTFPLFDGVSVVSFTCRIGKKVLRGLVKEKSKAKEVFDAAVARGETAGLLTQSEEASDVFTTKLGNIPAGEKVVVEISYIGELKHHDTEGIRFTIPTCIAPRYGSAPSVESSSLSQANNKSGIRIVVDVNMPEGSFIKGVQSPSHPIAVSMGTISTASNADPTMSKASATLSLGITALDKDFVLIVQSKDVGIPKAILEAHPTIPNHRALMATLVPKFSLPPTRPEIVFVADRSGSMNGNIESLVSAMTVFLRSIPTGVKFNICSFGSSHRFLWRKSKSYSQETLDEATKHLKTFAADMGGTETFEAIKATIEKRFTDIPLEIMLLTDGDIWRQENLFTYLNQQVELSKGNIRVFPLGIGNGVSHALIEGVARAGNGFAQAVQLGERMDSAVVRMLRGALSPHITDYTLEVKYEKADDDFELVDSVTEGMKVLLSEDEKPKPKSSATISLFDTGVDPEKENVKNLTVALPKIPTPKLLQAPHKIPTLFAFSRTTVYLLMSPDTVQRNPTAVILRGTSSHGPLALEIPIEVLSEPGETIHQLAAKKAVQDLEEGRGWLYDAKDQKGVLIKNKYPSCFDDLVKQEAVRLGEKFQVAGKWCSFVAVSDNDKEIEGKKALSRSDFPEQELDSESADDLMDFDASYDTNLTVLSNYVEEKKKDTDARRLRTIGAPVQSLNRFANAPAPVKSARMSSATTDMSAQIGISAPPPPRPAAPLTMAQGRVIPDRSGSMSLFGAPQQNHVLQSIESKSCDMGAPKSKSKSRSRPLFSGSLGGGLVGSGLSGAMNFLKKPSSDGSSSSNAAPPFPSQGGAPGGAYPPNHRKQLGSKAARKSSPSSSTSIFTSASISQPIIITDWSTATTADKVHALISLQDFSGAWSEVLKDGKSVLPFDIPATPEGVDKTVWITLLVVKFLEEKCRDEEGVWELVVEKARGWLAVSGSEKLDEVEAKAESVVAGN